MESCHNQCFDASLTSTIGNFLDNAASEWHDSLGAQFCVQLAALGHAMISMVAFLWTFSCLTTCNSFQDQTRCDVRDLLEALTIETNDLRRRHQDHVVIFDDDVQKAMTEERDKTAQTIVELHQSLVEIAPIIAVSKGVNINGTGWLTAASRTHKLEKHSVFKRQTKLGSDGSKPMRCTTAAQRP